MIELREILSNSSDFDLFKRLYFSVFPENERRDLSFFDETVSLLGIYSDDFVGFFALEKEREITHIVYFAIAEKYRGKGIGSRALQILILQFSVSKIMLDVERPIRSKPNFLERLRRLDFYLKNGFVECGIEYMWRGESYLVLSWPKPISKKRWSEFWERFHT